MSAPWRDRGSLTETLLARPARSCHGPGMGAFRKQRLSRREVLAAAGIMLAPKAVSAAETASAWAVASHSAIRLVDGGRAPDGALLAALAMRLKPGFKTYWRHPGDSGVPPIVRFEGLANLKSAELLFPAPKRFDDGAGGVSFGYLSEEVLLPILVTPIDPAKPVRLKLHADYAVCEKLCVPASGGAELLLAGRPTSHGDAVRQALAAVPARVALGAPGPLRILGFAKGREPGRFEVTLAVPESQHPELFVEAPQPWFLDAKDFVPAAAGRPARFAVQVVEKDRSGLNPDLTLTLVAGPKAIEVRAPLDIGLIAP